MEASSPQRAGQVLTALILVAAVANLNLAVANVALPDIGKAFDAGQTTLNLIAVGYSLGLAASVLYFGAVGDRDGRKLLLILGMLLTIPADCLAAWAPNVFFGRTRRVGRREPLRFDVADAELRFGAGTVADRTWKEGLDVVSCTAALRSTCPISKRPLPA